MDAEYFRVKLNKLLHSSYTVSICVIGEKKIEINSVIESLEKIFTHNCEFAGIYWFNSKIEFFNFNEINKYTNCSVFDVYECAYKYLEWNGNSLVLINMTSYNEGSIFKDKLKNGMKVNVFEMNMKEISMIIKGYARKEEILTPKLKNLEKLEEKRDRQNELFGLFNVGMTTDDINQCICNFCRVENFKLDRYKCIRCINYNLCGDCFSNRKTSKNHKLYHPMVRYTGPNEVFGETVLDSSMITEENLRFKFRKSVHMNVECNTCFKNPIEGMRLKCDVCNNYDVCYECYVNKAVRGSHNCYHPLLVIDEKLNFLQITPDNIEIEKGLGNGAFGKVFKAKLKSQNKTIALKVIVYNPLLSYIKGMTMDSLVESYLREIQAYTELNSNYIVRMYGYGVSQAQSGTELYLAMEYMQRGSLKTLIENEPHLSYRMRLMMACNIATGMKRIHQRNYIHRDLRPDNILVSANYIAKIADMGIAKFYNMNEMFHTLVGCAPYMPPEFYTGQYTQKLDIYTFGLTLFELFTGKVHTIEKRLIKLPQKSPVFEKLITDCLKENPEERPTAENLEATLHKHLFTFNNVIKNYGDYSLMSSDEKNKVFIHIHQMISEEFKK